jgi:anti-sigma factor RsiW
MASDSDRMARAGDYVLGLMDDRERQRAERDLALDPAFRDAVVRLAERMHVFDRSRPSDGEERWRLITRRIAEMPQMHLDGPHTDGLKRPVIPGRPPYAIGLRVLGGRRGLLTALALVAAFVLGYIARGL